MKCRLIWNRHIMFFHFLMNNYHIMLVNKLLVKHISFQRVAVPNPPCKCFPSFSTQRTFKERKERERERKRILQTSKRAENDRGRKLTRVSSCYHVIPSLLKPKWGVKLFIPYFQLNVHMHSINKTTLDRISIHQNLRSDLSSCIRTYNFILRLVPFLSISFYHNNFLQVNNQSFLWGKNFPSIQHTAHGNR